MRLSPPALFGSLACLMVAAGAVTGLMVVGGPGAARVQRFDDQRLDDLRRLSAAISHDYERRRALPASLDELARAEDGLPPSALRDPETATPYGYRITSQTAFELCASFARPSREDEAIRWRHAAGRRCFAGEVAPP